MADKREVLALNSQALPAAGFKGPSFYKICLYFDGGGVAKSSVFLYFVYFTKKKDEKKVLWLATIRSKLSCLYFVIHLSLH
jgi:hypothetical protein